MPIGLFYMNLNHYDLIILPKTFTYFAAMFLHAKITVFQRQTWRTLFRSITLVQKNLFWPDLPEWWNYIGKSHPWEMGFWYWLSLTKVLGCFFRFHLQLCKNLGKSLFSAIGLQKLSRSWPCFKTGQYCVIEKEAVTLQRLSSCLCKVCQNCQVRVTRALGWSVYL